MTDAAHGASSLALSEDPAEDETLLERRYRFLSQRNAGGTFRSIAELHNKKAVAAVVDAGRDPSEAKTVSPATVRKDVERAKHEIISESTRESLIAEQRSVLLDVRKVNYAGMLNGDVDSTKAVLNTVVQMREMFGLDQPKRTNIGVGTDVEFARDLAELFTLVGGTPPSDLLFAARDDSRDARDVLDVEVLDDDPFDHPDVDADICASPKEDAIRQRLQPPPDTDTSWSNL